jgi:hypothetical protein
MNLIGVNESFPAIKFPTDADVKALVDRVHQLGGKHLIVYYIDISI